MLQGKEQNRSREQEEKTREDTEKEQAKGQGRQGQKTWATMQNTSSGQCSTFSIHSRKISLEQGGAEEQEHSVW